MNLDIKPADFDVEKLQPGEAVAIDWDAARYHADTQTVSRSEAWLLHKHPPSYHAIVVEQSMPGPQSKDMDRGTLVHLAVLERDRFLAEVKIRPAQPASPRPRDRDRFTTAAKFGVLARSSPRSSPPVLGVDPWSIYDAQNEFLDAHAASGGHVMTQCEAERVTGIAHKVSTHRYARALLALPGVNEQTIVWREPTTGLLCRLRLDSMRELEDEAGEIATVVVDLKSTRTPEPTAFGRSIAKLGYDFQAGFYTDGVQALYPDREIIYAIIAAGNEQPYTVSAGPLRGRAVAEGRRKYKAALADLVQRRATNNWRAPWEEDHDLVFDMPHWAYPKDNR